MLHKFTNEFLCTEYLYLERYDNLRNEYAPLKTEIFTQSFKLLHDRPHTLSGLVLQTLSELLQKVTSSFISKYV